MSRVEGPLKVEGRALYAAEFDLDGLVHAAIRCSTIARGRIAELDTSEAEKAPGVVLVMTYRNAPRIGPMPLFETHPRASGHDDLPVMQDDAIYWNGQPVAVVLAETIEQADHASTLLRITYDEGPAVTSYEQAKASRLVQARLFGQPLRTEAGDPDGALERSHASIDATYRTPHQNHNAIEPHAVTVAWKEGRLLVHDASQSVSDTAWALSTMLGVAEEQVEVTSTYVGGGFGGKLLWQHQVLAAAAARLAERPVRLALSREDVHRVVGGRTATEQRVAIGAAKDGRFQSIIHSGISFTSEHSRFPEPFSLAAQHSYRAPNHRFEQSLAYMALVGNSTMRAPGHAVGNFAFECAVDELADALGMDPIALRILNRPTEDPLTGRPFSNDNAAAAWRAGAERFGWDARDRASGFRDGEWLVGTGFAGASYPYQRFPGGAARITLDSDGRALVEAAAHDMGMGTETVQTLVAAEVLGLEPGKVSFAYGSSHHPGRITAAGSQQTANVAAAVIAAKDALLVELLKMLPPDSPLAGVAPGAVDTREGGIVMRDDPGRSERYETILRRAGLREITVEAEGPPPAETQSWSMHSSGGMFCEVRVNAITGEIRVSRFLASMDCGRILSAKTAASQFRGAVVMGLGLALLEETRYDERTARITNPSLSEYHVPTHLDVPEIDLIWTDVADPHAPLGARGIGENRGDGDRSGGRQRDPPRDGSAHP